MAKSGLIKITYSKETEMVKSKLLEQVRYAVRVRHFSIRTEQAYVHWIKRFILFHGKRHPNEITESEVSKFLSFLAVKKLAMGYGVGPRYLIDYPRL